MVRPPGRSNVRRADLLVAGVAVVVGAIVFGVALGGLGSTPPTPTPRTGAGATPGLDGLSLVPVAAAPDAAASSVPSGSTAVQVSPGPTEVAGTGIRAIRIRIERLDIDLPIVEGDGIDAPIDKAAHYPESAWPGAGSNIYVYGHAQEGMFISLWHAREGDIVELDLINGTSRAYVVEEVLPEVPWNAIKYVRPTATEQLTLQTSTSYHATSPRFIVIAHPAS
jgi:LPXTG-site transpeptidase (sortase) family protein